MSENNHDDLPIKPKGRKPEQKTLAEETSVEQEPEMLNEIKLSWAGKLFFASAAAFIANDVMKTMKLPMKVRGKPDQVKALVDAIVASKAFQKEMSKPGAKVEDVVKKLNLKNMNKSKFKQLTGKEFPL